MNHLFGFLQIVLESLPISSSGHLAIVGLSAPVFFERFVHGPTVLVLLVYFWRELWELLRNYKTNWRQLVCWIILIVFANSFTVLVYALLEKFQIGIPLWLGFMITGCALMSLCFGTKHNKAQTSSLFLMGVIGIVQGCARLAGISRLGVTYVTAVLFGFEPKKALRISCALQLPLFTAGFLEGFFGAWRVGQLGTLFSFTFLILTIFAMVGAYFLLALVEWLMVNNKLWYLGVYVMVPTVFALFCIIS